MAEQSEFEPSTQLVESTKLGPLMDIKQWPAEKNCKLRARQRRSMHGHANRLARHLHPCERDNIPCMSARTPVSENRGVVTAISAARCQEYRFASSGIDCKRATYGEGNCTGRHYHDESNLVLVLSGSLTQDMQSRVSVITPVSLLFVPAGERHSTTFGSRGACCFFMAFDESWIRRRLEMAAEAPWVASSSATDLQCIALRVYEEFKNPDRLSNLIVEGALLELFGRWFRKGLRPYKDAPGWLSTVRLRLHDSFRNSITLSELSRDVGVHPSHIAREFHRVYGQTVGEYLRKVRVECVASVLRNSSKQETSLTDLALRAGFSSHAHMCSVFKRTTGMTPSDYMKAYNGVATVRSRQTIAS
jgi:AraC family transcriptional regulator